MRKFIILLFIGAISAGAHPPLDPPLVKDYQKILFEIHSGGHTPRALSPALRKEFLSQPMIKDLVHLYRKSVLKTGHPANSPSRSFIAALQRLYEKHLIEEAMRVERSELNKLVQLSMPNEQNEFALETKHLEILGDIFDDITIDVLESYKEKNTEGMRSYGALSLYVLTEAAVRISLYNMGYQAGLSPFARVVNALTPSNTDSLTQSFWVHSDLTKEQSIQLTLPSIEKLAGKGFAELVTEYQTIFAENSCEGLLAARHPRREG